MGRKIPGKKHHGVKDPEKQKEKREKELKQKTNSKPKNLDDQEIPKKLLMLSKLREEAKQPSKPKPKVPKSKLLDSTKLMGYEMKLPGMKKDLKPIPIFQQQEGEKQRQFFRRMNQQVAQFMRQKEYEAKFNVDIVQDAQNGKTKFVEREKDEIDEHVEKLKAKKLEKKGNRLQIKRGKKERKTSERKRKKAEKET